MEPYPPLQWIYGGIIQHLKLKQEPRFLYPVIYWNTQNLTYIYCV